MKTSRAVCLLLILASCFCEAGFPPLSLKSIVLDQLQSPVNITHAGDGSGRLFVCEQRGKIRVIQNGMLLPTVFLDLSAKLVPERPGFDERGLLGLAFHPGYADPVSPGLGRFYVFYSAPSPNAPGTAAAPVNCRSVIAEYRVSANNPTIADPASERILLGFDKPQFNHNAGQLAFGPDGFLYVATGDGGGSNDNDPSHTGGSAAKPNGVLGNAQDKTKLLGKILRIDPLGNNAPGGQYGIPAANPFVSAGGGVRGEVYAFGLRNPWRFSFDPPTGRLFCADGGQGRVEEIDLIASGGNYGWRAREGSFNFDATAPNGGLPLINPIAQYEHPGLNPSLGLLPVGISATGGYVYRGRAIPQLAGKYVFGDWSVSFSTPAGTLLGLEETAPNTWALSRLTLTNGNPIPTRVLAFGRDEEGEIYVATNVTQAPSGNDPSTGRPAGGIYKVVAGAAGSVTLEPAKDNTLFEEFPEFSSGQGFLYAGRTAQGNARHALLAFDVAGALPAGANITSAMLTLSVNRSSSPPRNFSLHKLGESWGEGASDAGDPGGLGIQAEENDATWSYRFYRSANPAASPAWTTPGGAFAASASATASVGGLGSYTWMDDALIADVRTWLNLPGENFGWLLRTEELVTSAKRFASGESTIASARPRLAISYTIAPPRTRWEQWLQQYFRVGEFVDDTADLDGDGLPNGIEYAFALSPLARDPESAGVQISAVSSGPNTVFTITFPRDPRASDLTYQLQTSSDLVNWTTVVESSAGATPIGPAFISEAPIAGAAPVVRVAAEETLPSTSGRFARLRVVRQ